MDLEATKQRAGVYVRQPTGYRAFIPAPLPPKPPIRVEGELAALLSAADLALGRLDGSVVTLPHPDLFIFMYVRKEAVLSSQIEGAQSSLQDLLEAEAALYDGARPRDVEEVIRYISALKLGLASLAALPVSVRLIRNIHAELMKGARGGRLQPGELRVSQNWIGAPGCTLNTASFVPPPAHEVAPALSALEKFLHADDSLPPLVKIALAHVQFETIHPFLDGNGRLGRLLITFLLTECGILHQPVLYLSHFFKQHRPAYYEHLQAVRDHGAWEAWLKFFLRGVISVAREASDTARRIQLLREAHRTAITQHCGRAAGNGLRVLERLFDKPIVSVAQVREITGTTYAAANAMVQRMVEIGVLEEMTGYARNRRFQYGPYVRLFTDEMPATPTNGRPG